MATTRRTARKTARTARKTGRKVARTVRKTGRKKARTARKTARAPRKTGRKVARTARKTGRKVARTARKTGRKVAALPRRQERGLYCQLCKLTRRRTPASPAGVFLCPGEPELGWAGINRRKAELDSLYRTRPYFPSSTSAPIRTAPSTRRQTKRGAIPHRGQPTRLIRGQPVRGQAAIGLIVVTEQVFYRFQ